MNTITKNKKILVVIFLVFLGFLLYLPGLLFEGISYYQGEDAFFHLNRLKGLENVFISPVNYSSYDGKGILVNIFYPWLTMYPMYLFYVITGSYIFSYKLFYLFYSVISLFVSFYSLYHICKNMASSFVFAVLYSFCTYHCVNVFRRAALGESIAMIFYPILIAALYDILLDEYNKWFILSIGISLVAYSHVLSLLISSFVVLCLFSLMIFFSNHRTERIQAFIKAVGLSVMLSFGVLVPIIVYSSSDNIYIPDGSGEILTNNAFSVINILSTSLWNIPLHQGLGIAVIIAFLADVLLIFILNKSTNKFSLCLVCSGLIMFLFTSSSIPWNKFAHIGFLRIIQFPWRLNGYVSLFFTFGFALLLHQTVKKMKTAYTVLMLLTCISIIMNFYSVYTLNNEDHYIITDESFDYTIVDYDDYANEESVRFRIENGYVPIEDVYIDDCISDVECYISKDGSSVYVFGDALAGGCELDLPYILYSTTDVKINGIDTQTRMSDRGTVLVDLTVSEDNIIEITNHYPFSVYFSWVISLISVFILIFIIRANKRLF